MEQNKLNKTFQREWGKKDKKRRTKFPCQYTLGSNIGFIFTLPPFLVYCCKELLEFSCILPIQVRKNRKSCVGMVAGRGEDLPSLSFFLFFFLIAFFIFPFLILVCLFVSLNGRRKKKGAWIHQNLYPLPPILSDLCGSDCIVSLRESNLWNWVLVSV